MRKKTATFFSLLLGGVAVMALAGTPAVSETDIDSRLADFGVPGGAEVVAIQSRPDGTLTTVIYEDDSGQRVTLGGVVRQETPRPE